MVAVLSEMAPADRPNDGRLAAAAPSHEGVVYRHAAADRRMAGRGLRRRQRLAGRAGRGRGHGRRPGPAPRRSLRRRAGQPRGRGAERPGPDRGLSGRRGRRADHRAGHAERAGNGRPLPRSRRRRLRLRPHRHHAKPDLGHRPGRAAASTRPREPAAVAGRAGPAAARARRGRPVCCSSNGRCWKAPETRRPRPSRPSFCRSTSCPPN